MGEILLLAAIALAGALVFGITGFGAALITIPLATHLVPLRFALALFVLVDLACALRVGFENPKNAVRAEWTRLVPMIIAGTAVGVTLLVNLPRQAATAALGVFIVAYALYSLSKPSLRKIPSGWAWLAGFAGGITSTVFGAGGPPYVIYLSRRGLTQPQFRATLGFATLTSISLRAVAFILTGLLLDARIWLAALAAVPAALVGIEVARRIYVGFSRALLFRVVALVLLASGVSLLLRSA
ncbi:MAG: permease [Burkholderiales bacterium]|nr:permease [Burkholderiales bacterium]